VKLHSLFEQQAELTPDSTALIFEDEHISYAELNRLASQLATYLKSLKNNGLVALYMERSAEMVIAMLASLKAGAAYVPLDTEYPTDRLGTMLDDASPGIILTQQNLQNRLAATSIKTLALDNKLELLDQDYTAKEPQSHNTDGNDIAYVIYTSGSTGTPKGVMNTHKGICNRLLWMQDEYQLNANDRVFQKTPYSFDVSVWEFFWPLITGATMVIAKPGGHKDSHYLASTIQQEKITVLHFVPSMLRLFLDQPGLADYCKTLRHVICSGEALMPDLRNRYYSILDAKLHNLYGPTEAAIDVTYWECAATDADDTIPIGRPVANTSIYILDETLNPVTPGQTGEIHIGGVQVAKGYLNRPELTAKRFIHDPFNNETDAMLYKTGDLGRQREDGAFEFLGRIDHQVKLRGIRTELGEVESHLETHDSVKQAVAVVREDRPGDQKLIAYIVLHDDNKASLSELRSHVENSLPEHMVPSVFMVLETMPLTVSGKVDRKKLPAPGHERPDLDQPYVAPETKLESYLVKIWQEILGLDRVGIHDRFFELGGTSIQAATVISQLQKDLDEFIYVLTIFDAPTVHEYARFLQKDYPQAISKKLGKEFSGENHPADKAGDDKLDAQAVKLMEECIVTLNDNNEANEKSSKNSRAIFILAPPRSGTTLLRVMLAGHPELFAAAELQMLGFNNLQERKQAYSGKYKLWREGSIRAIMEIKSCDADEAGALMSQFEEQQLTTKQFFAVLQEWIGDKILVDKSPSYGLDLLSLQKAEMDFEDPMFIHLVRHPYAMIKSFERYHMDQVLFLKQQPFSPRMLGELVWYVTHRNILEFQKQIPQNRYFRICFEDMVNNPDSTMQSLCERFGLSYHSNLVDPYQDIENKMIDGLHKVSIPMGDTNLLTHKSINPKVAESWKGVLDNNFISDLTWQLAEELGYKNPATQAEQLSSPATSSRRDALRNRRKKKQ